MRLARISALIGAGLTLSVALFATNAVASPQKESKPARKAAGKKPPVKKDDGKALVADGKKIYEKHGCSGCHAIKGEGGKSAAELTKVAANPKHNAKWLETAIINPKAIKPTSTMPSYEESIKGKDLKALVAYLGTLKGK